MSLHRAAIWSTPLHSFFFLLVEIHNASQEPLLPQQTRLWSTCRGPPSPETVPHPEAWQWLPRANSTRRGALCLHHRLQQACCPQRAHVRSASERLRIETRDPPRQTHSDRPTSTELHPLGGGPTELESDGGWLHSTYGGRLHSTWRYCSWS